MTESQVSDNPRIHPEVARRLGYYVYLYSDPGSGKPFYVGKGKGSRALAHLSEEAESQKCAKLAELRAAGREPRIDILAHALPDAATALRIEAAVIDLLRLDGLTNQVRGWHSLTLGRWPLSELHAQYAAKPVTVREPALLIRINRLYRPEMSKDELYEATRGVWKVGARRTKARFAFAVFESVVREVYMIESWHDAATTPYSTRDATKLDTEGRREFIGRVADPAIRNRYVGRSVRKQFRQGLQNPVMYVNC